MSELKSFDLRELISRSEEGEYVLGVKDLGTHACYMIYGVLAPGETGRVIEPGKGHEEIILAVKGDLEVEGVYAGTLREGSAFHVAGEDTCFVTNPSQSEQAIYVAAGGHSAGGH